VCPSIITDGHCCGQLMRLSTPSQSLSQAKDATMRCDTLNLRWLFVSGGKTVLPVDTVIQHFTSTILLAQLVCMVIMCFVTQSKAQKTLLLTYFCTAVCCALPLACLALVWSVLPGLYCLGCTAWPLKPPVQPGSHLSGGPAEGAGGSGYPSR